MRTYISAVAILLLCAFTYGDFKDGQRKYPRVRTAFAEKENTITSTLTAKGVSPQQLRLFIRGFKEERKLEAWVSNSGGQYSLYKTFDFCSSSGSLGPKRRQGDGQIPEGLYHIDRFNPSSNFYLSMGINYPNASDVKRKIGTDAGGDIFIHGACVTIGCIPITDDKIKELYALAVMAKDAGQDQIPVHLFPFKMTVEGLGKHRGTHSNFWNELEPFYSYFETQKRIPGFSITANGQYLRR